MAAPVLNIPRTVNITTPEATRLDIERMSLGLYDFARQVSENVALETEFPPVARVGTVGANYDKTLVIAPAQSSTEVTVQLPQPKTIDGGRTLGLLRRTTNGSILVVPLGGALINGMARMFLLGSPMITTVTFDGVNFWANNQGAAAWDEGL